MSTSINTLPFTGDLTDPLGTAQELDQDGNSSTPPVIFSTLTADVDIPSGTGVIQPFVRIEEDNKDANDTQEGYNYEPDLTGNPPDPLDVKDRQQVVDLTQVKIVNVNGVDYYDFRLDANEPNNTASRLITITDLRVYSSNQADL